MALRIPRPSSCDASGLGKNFLDLVERAANGWVGFDPHISVFVCFRALVLLPLNLVVASCCVLFEDPMARGICVRRRDDRLQRLRDVSPNDS